MAEMFLKLEGIPGESKDEVGHKDEIEVLSYSWGLAQPTSWGSGGGGGEHKVQPQDISFSFITSKATPKLVQAICNGDHIPTATLTLRKAGGKQLEYLVYEFKDLTVSSYSSGASGDQVVDNFSFGFASVKSKYKEQLPDGNGVDAGEYQYNFKTHTPTF